MPPFCPARCSLFPYTTLFRSALAEACAAAGLIFVGPSVPVLELLGDKVRARALAVQHGVRVLRGSKNRTRSEEHTSELQSHVKVVCRLLFEKKKNGVRETVVT